jgi:D-glycero-D-manno-heptose 1,7-bisphosphate phosphatase
VYPAIFLDRDGVLIENRSDYVRDWSQVNVLPDAIRALSSLTVKNYKVIIVTNQSAVGRGLMSLKTANEINEQLVNLIHRQGGKLDAVYICPHRPEENCFCRKPRPGLLLQAANDLSLDLSRSWMIGDAWSDLQAGQMAGVRQSILVRTGRGKEQLLLPRPESIVNYLIFDDLIRALDGIRQSDNAAALHRQP